MATSLEQQAKEKIPPIITAIDALDAHWKKLGTEKAFDPNDPQTARLFQQLWSVSFDQRFPIDLQGEIIRQLEKSHKPKLARMRQISVASEIEMEKGHASNAIAAATQCGPDPRIRELREKMTQAKAEHKDDEVKKLHRQLVEAKTKAFYSLLSGYPYHTYHTLVSSEMPLLSAVEGLNAETQAKGLHLVIGAGAIPFTAIFSSIFRDDGEVLGTIADPKCYSLATELLQKMEQIGITAPQTIKLVAAKPDDALRSVHFLNAKGERRVPYAATITQVIDGKAKTEKAVRALNNLGIDTIIGRGAHGLVQLLYEPLDDMPLPSKLKTHLMGVPQSSEKASPVCYNSSHLFSSRKVIGIPQDSPTHTFSNLAERENRRA